MMARSGSNRPPDDRRESGTLQFWGTKWMWITIAILVIWAALPGALIFYFYPQIEKSGQFSDAFGIVTALFSALSMLGVILAIYLQNQELALQRQELRETREELRRSADAQERAQEAATIQARSLLDAAEINAIVARIRVYDHQIPEYEAYMRGKGGDVAPEQELVKGMRDERRNLYLCLDGILERLHPGARGPQPNDPRHGG